MTVPEALYLIGQALVAGMVLGFVVVVLLAARP